eukprot:3240895-Pyramimonas_sp.AAC.1
MPSAVPLGLQGVFQKTTTHEERHPDTSRHGRTRHIWAKSALRLSKRPQEDPKRPKEPSEAKTMHGSQVLDWF